MSGNMVRTVAVAALLLAACGTAPDHSDAAQSHAAPAKPAAAPTGSDAPLTIRLADGSSATLVASKRDGKHGMSDAQCAVTIDRQPVETIGSGDTDTYTCGALEAAGRLSAKGGSRRIGLIYRVSSSNAHFNTALILVEHAGRWAIDPQSVGAFDDTPAAKFIAVLRLASR